MSYITHILKADTQADLEALVASFLVMNPLWQVTGQIQYNGSYYYQGVIQLSTSTNNEVVMSLAAALDQIAFDLGFYLNPNTTPVFLVNGQQQKYNTDFTISEQQLLWESNDFSLAPTDDIRVAFTFNPNN